MRKILTVFTVAMSCFLFAGCGDDSEMLEPDAGEVDAGESNTAPTLGPSGVWTIAEDYTTTLPVFVTDAETANDGLTVTATSSDESIIPSENVILTANPFYWLVTITPAVDAVGGPVTITLSVSDGESSANESFDVTVVPVNDAPSFTAGSDPAVTAIGASEQTVSGWATDISAGAANESDQNFSFHVSTNRPDLFSEGPAISAEGTLTFTPRAHQWGVATVYVYLQDDGGGVYPDKSQSPTQEFEIEIACLEPEPPGTFFAGVYLMQQLSGLDPFFAAETFGDTQFVNIAANGHERDFDFVYYPGIFNSNYHFTMNLCGGDIHVRGYINSGGLGCGGVNIGFNTYDPAGTYPGTGAADDDVVGVDVLDFEPDGNCDKDPYLVELQFTQQE